MNTHQPHARARPRVALLLDTLWDDFEARLWRGVVSEARAQDVSMLCFAVGALQSPYSASANRHVLNDLVGPENVDGVLIVSGCVGAFLEPVALRRYVRRFAQLPLICVSSRLDEFPCIRVDNRSGMRDLVSHFIEEHGCRRVAFISGLEGNFDAHERFEAYKEALASHGIPFDPQLVVTGNFTPESGARAITTLLEERKLPFDAVIAANDHMALEAIRALRAAGVSVPRQVCVGGFDDIPDGRGEIPSLTTVRQPTYELGRYAMAQMAQWLKTGQAVGTSVLPTRLVVRGTCGCSEGRSARIVSGSTSAPVTVNDPARIAATAEQVGRRFVVISDILGHDNWTRALTHSYLEACENEDDALQSTLDTIMRQCEWSELSSSIWSEVLHYLFGLLEAPQHGASRVRDDAFLYVNRYSEMRQIRNWAEHATQTGFLQRFQQPLADEFSSERLKTVIEETLPRLHINGFWLSLYQDGAINTKGQCYPLITLERTPAGTHAGRTYDADAPRFPAAQLTPNGLQHDHALLINVMPLFFDDEQFGFSVFDMDAVHPTAVEVINSHLISIIQGFRVLEETRHYTDKLERDVAARTADLQSKNRQIEKLNEELIQKNRLDVLTNLYNRGAVYEFLRKELSRTRRGRVRDRDRGSGRKVGADHRMFSVMMCDVDHFKHINDTYGHIVGDHVLKKIGDLLRDSGVFRQEDVPGRFGGEEFIVVLASVDAENASYPAARFAEMLKNVAFAGNDVESFSVTVSIGISQYHDDDSSEEQVINRADQALYYAKNHGRDRIVIYEQTPDVGRASTS